MDTITKPLPDMIDQWKINKIRSYFNGGWKPERIAIKLKVHTYEVYDVIYENPIKTTVLGNKSEAYYEDEMDYLKLGSAPLPSFVILSD